MSATVVTDDLEEEVAPRAYHRVFSQNSLLTPEQRLRADVRFYFMNPKQKWKLRRRFPYKLLLQLLKILFVTLQLILFAQFRYSHVNYLTDMQISLENKFLKDWSPSREVNFYPPSQGPLAVYGKSQFFDTINYAVDAFQRLDTSIGSFYHVNEDSPVLNFCLTEYAKGEVWGSNQSYIFNPRRVVDCMEISVPPAPRNGTPPLSELLKGIEDERDVARVEAFVLAMGAEKRRPPEEERDVAPFHFDLKSFLLEINKTLNFDALLRADLSFTIKTVNFRRALPMDRPDCYQMAITISLDNEDHDGQVMITLTAVPMIVKCCVDSIYIGNAHDQADMILRSFLNFVVITICTLSFILCTRAMYRAWLLKERVNTFFRRCRGKQLCLADQCEFLNLWYVMITANDCLIIAGSTIKQLIEYRRIEGDLWDVCGVLLGTGNLLVWIGVLRYLGFFRKYNILIITLKRAFPNVLRFLLCVIILYAGFTLCGWLVLGPYHLKFRNLATSSECLFSLVNGDDMFATFAALEGNSGLIRTYSKLYLYLFISLFIYVVLSLFIALILDTYETIKAYYNEGFPQSELDKFINEGEEVDFHENFIADEPCWNVLDLCSRLCAAFMLTSSSPRREPNRPSPEGVTERTPLIQ